MTEMRNQRWNDAPNVVTMMKLIDNTMYVARWKLKLIFSNGSWQLVQEIVQHDAQNSDAFQQMIIGLGEHLTRKNDGEVSGGVNY